MDPGGVPGGDPDGGDRGGAVLDEDGLTGDEDPFCPCGAPSPRGTAIMVTANGRTRGASGGPGEPHPLRVQVQLLQPYQDAVPHGE